MAGPGLYERIRLWAPHAQHPQRGDLAEAVLDLDARLRGLEAEAGRYATVDAVEALRQQMGRVAEAVPHAWVLLDAREPTQPVLVDVFATPEAARRAAEGHHGAVVRWPDAAEATVQTGYVQPPGEGGSQRPRYRLERRALRGA